MKTLCAWCGSTISINCDHCGSPLIAADYVGCTFTTDTKAMLCLNGQTPLVYSTTSILTMTTSHGLCQPCSKLTEEERAQPHRKAP
jgi:hypothetical protein